MAAEPPNRPPPPEPTAPKPVWLRYPDSKPAVWLGEGVYFHPAVQSEKGARNPQNDEKNFRDFMALAQSVTNCFAGDGKRVKLDEQFCKDVWDSSPEEFEFIRVDWAANELCSILEKTPTAGLGEGHEIDQGVWGVARQVLLNDMMSRCSTRGLTFTVEPPLPEGIGLAESTGVLSGHPTSAWPRQTYVITASNSRGSVNCDVEFEVLDAKAPEKLEYRKVEAAYLAGKPLVLMPTVLGVVTCWQVRPPLPQNLRLDASTGTISGIPVDPAAETAYTVIAKNDLGTSVARVTFAIVLAPPYGLKYHTDSDCMGSERTGFCGRQAVLTFPVHRPMCLRPTVDGEVETWEVSPALPDGVYLDPSSGMISGTPSLEKPVTPYSVLASNESGSTKVTLSFGVKLLPTISVAYHGFDDVYCVGEFVDIEPTVQGGSTRWTVTPELPPSIKLHQGSGAIYGYCRDPCDETSYTITAENDAGGTSTVVTFAIIALPPEGLDYTYQSTDYVIGQRVYMEPDLLCGSGSVDFSVTPELPDGLSLDKDTGVIRGEPREAAEPCVYKVTASNCQGSTTCDVCFWVLEKPKETQSLQRQTTLKRLPSGHVPVRSLTRTASILRGAAANDASGKGNGDLSRKTTRDSQAQNGADAKPKVAAAAGNLGAIAEDDEAATEEDSDLDSWDSDMRDAKAWEETAKFASDLQDVKEVKDLPDEPNKFSQEWEWMLWSVHRVWLDDEKLTSLSFKGLDLPLPDVEPRIGQKLFQALTMNKHLHHLDLTDSNLRGPHINLLAGSLKNNAILQTLSVDENHLDPDNLLLLADALKTSTASKLTTLCCREMKGVTEFGRQVDQAMAGLMESNLKLVKFTYECKDLHYASVIERSLKRNMDSARREVKNKAAVKSTGDADKMQKTGERQASAIQVVEKPGQTAGHVFRDNPKLDLVRHFTADKKRMPTKEQLQIMAKNRGQPLKYAEVAPLARDFRTRLLDIAVGQPVVATDTTAKKLNGTLRSWSEKNNRWVIEVQTDENSYVAFTSAKDPVVEVTPAVADWMALNE